MTTQHKRREIGLCSLCGQQTYGSYCCPIHEAYKNALQKGYRQRHQELLRQKGMVERKHREENNQCIRCGAPLIEDEQGYCIACLSGRYEAQIKGVLR